MESQHDYIRRKLDNNLAFCINTMIAIRNDKAMQPKEKLRLQMSVEAVMPEIRRGLIYFLNLAKGN